VVGLNGPGNVLGRLFDRLALRAPYFLQGLDRQFQVIH
jgi:hypothetical protein